MNTPSKLFLRDDELLTVGGDAKICQRGRPRSEERNNHGQTQEATGRGGDCRSNASP
jgi:hypothetical protein